LASHIKGRTKTEGFRKRVLMMKFGQKREEVTGNWRKLRNEKIRNLFSSPDNIIGLKSKRMRRGGGGELHVWDIKKLLEGFDG